MNCKKCKAEWTPPANISIDKCPFCGSALFEVSKSKENAEPHEILLNIVQQYNKNKLGDTLLKGMLSDLMPHVEKKYQRIFKQALDDKIGLKLLELENEDDSMQNIKLNTLRHSFKNNNGFDSTADYVVDCFLFALGWIETVSKEQYSHDSADNLSVIAQQIDMAFIDGVLNRDESAALFSISQKLGLTDNVIVDLINAKIKSLKLVPNPPTPKSIKNKKEIICASDWGVELKSTKQKSDFAVPLPDVQKKSRNLKQDKELDKNNSKNNLEKELKDIEFIVENPNAEEVGEKVIKTAEQKSIGIDTQFDPTQDLPDFKYPTLNLLKDYDVNISFLTKEELEINKNKIVDTLKEYSIRIVKIKATIGPVITFYEVFPAIGINIAKIKNIKDIIALSLSTTGIRIITPIPGKVTIGIEIPNQNPCIVSIKSILGSGNFRNTKFDLPIGIGKTTGNESFVFDLTKMPNLLIAGAAGQGKTVGINAIIASLLYSKHPAELKFILVDPKKVEFNLYSQIERHYLAKLPSSEKSIISDTNIIIRTLVSLSIEMYNRHELLKDAQVRNIKEYNAKFNSRKLNPLHGHRYMPYLVMVIDEFADLITTGGKQIESPITSISQLGGSKGIHLIIATQQPSVKIVTNTIKANFPTRLAFRANNKADSKMTLDGGGSDQLVGKGDMLFSAGTKVTRLQCAFIDYHEVESLTTYIGSQRAYPDALHLPEFKVEEDDQKADYELQERDELFEDAALIIVQNQQGSTSLIQRKLKLGYNRAGRIIDQLEAAGIVGPFEGSKARQVKVRNEMELQQYLKGLDNQKIHPMENKEKYANNLKNLVKSKLNKWGF